MPRWKNNDVIQTSSCLQNAWTFPHDLHCCLPSISPYAYLSLLFFMLPFFSPFTAWFLNALLHGVSLSNTHCSAHGKEMSGKTLKAEKATVDWKLLEPVEATKSCKLPPWVILGHLKGTLEQADAGLSRILFVGESPCVCSRCCFTKSYKSYWTMWTNWFWGVGTGILRTNTASHQGGRNHQESPPLQKPPPEQIVYVAQKRKREHTGGYKEKKNTVILLPKTVWHVPFNKYIFLWINVAISSLKYSCIKWKHNMQHSLLQMY